MEMKFTLREHIEIIIECLEKREEEEKKETEKWENNDYLRGYERGLATADGTIKEMLKRCLKEAKG